MARIGVITPVKARDDTDVAWLCEGIESVLGQSIDDWNMVIVNDHSVVEFKDYKRLRQLFKDERVSGARNPQQGVSSARNLAAEKVDAELLLPLDHDDWFPKDAFEIYLGAWDDGGSEKGLVYGDTKLVQQNSQRIFAGAKYNFDSLLKTLFLPVGSLHRKTAWGRVGGWKLEMDQGLEDWEYWIALGELGVCGHYVPKVTYIYRRHARGRLADLRTHQDKFARAQATMRQLHLESFNGRKQMGCCGGGGGRSQPTPRQAPPQKIATMLLKATPDKLVQVEYTGNLSGSHWVTGRNSGLSYIVMGKFQPLRLPDGRPGVMPQDVQWMLGLDRGKSFRRVQP
jgi:hypothetical protein